MRPRIATLHHPKKHIQLLPESREPRRREVQQCLLQKPHRRPGGFAKGCSSGIGDPKADNTLVMLDPLPRDDPHFLHPANEVAGRGKVNGKASGQFSDADVGVRGNLRQRPNLGTAQLCTLLDALVMTLDRAKQDAKLLKNGVNALGILGVWGWHRRWLKCRTKDRRKR